MVELSETLRTEGVHMIGDFSGRTGLCQSGREMLEVMRVAGIPVEVLDLPLSPDRMPPTGRLEIPAGLSQPKSRLSIINWNGDINALLARDLPREIFAEGRKFVGIWYWETSILPDRMRQGFDLVDEVWVTSHFIADSLAASAPKPVRWFPAPLAKPAPSASHAAHPALNHDRFVFLFCFDYRSIARRKNPHGVCEAFVRAFPEETPHGPLCIIKSVAGRSEKFLEYAELRFRYRHRGDILFWDGWMPEDERNALMARANCYVSLHRAEGLGLTLMESMTLGKPCITTAYSGNMDFSTADNSWLIPYRKTVIGDGVPPYPANHEWAEPDLDAAATAMREAYQNPSLCEAKGQRGAKDIAQNHSLEAVAQQVTQLLEQALLKPGAPKALQQTVEESKQSGRAAAYQILKEARTLRVRLKDQWRATPPKKSDEMGRSLQDILKLLELQQQAQSEILRELGTLKQQVAEFISGGNHTQQEMLGKFKVIEQLVASGVAPEALPILNQEEAQRKRAL